MKNFKFIKYFLVILCISTVLSSCSRAPKILGQPPIEPNARKRAEQNVKDGKGIRFFKNSRGDGTFLFASSNPMWKAALDTLDFMSLASSDYSGGVIITDWYSEGNPNEAIKITIRFLSNEIRADGIQVIIHEKICKKTDINNCKIKKIKSNIQNEIKLAILKKATILKKESNKNNLKKRKKKNR
mgnify:CR=1 FL=1